MLVLSATFLIGRWSEWRWLANKAAKVQLDHRIFVFKGHLGVFPDVSMATKWVLFKNILVTFPAIFVVTKTSCFSWEGGPSPSMILATKTGILTHPRLFPNPNRVFFVHKPNYNISTALWQDRNRTHICNISFKSSVLTDWSRDWRLQQRRTDTCSEVYLFLSFLKFSLCAVLSSPKSSALKETTNPCTINAL